MLKNKFIFAMVFLVSAAASADSDAIDAAGVEAHGKTILDDQRLPPVLPGEEVGPKDQRIKVWSSSGAVPSALLEEARNPKPEPTEAPHLILDTR